MAPQQSSSKSPSRKDIYENVTDRIIARLEEGVVPWQCPHIATVGFPKNFQSGREYRGINIMLLGMCGYISPYFMTYLQARERGGQVRRGESGHLVVKFGEYAKKDGNQVSGVDEREEVRRYLRGYSVFNACQIDGVEFPQVMVPDRVPSETVQKAAAIVAGMPNPPVIHEGRVVRTCYYPDKDSIDIPNRGFFESEERFFKSLFHEIIHATGAAKRLARKTLVQNKGRIATDVEIYSKEELVAEIGAAFLCAHAGIVIDDHENSASYIASWLKVLKTKSNRRWLVEAAGHAQQAVEYTLNMELK